MTHTPKTMSEIRDEIAEEYCNKIDNNVAEYFKAGFDCRDKLDNEALKVAVDFLEMKSKRSSYEWSSTGDYSPDDYANEGQAACANEALAKIRELRGDG
jgi:hypothetical protein